MADVFISYSRVDFDRAEALADTLVARGLSVWWDRKLEGGSRFSKEIEAALAEAESIVVLWSAASVESGWVLDEAGVGRDAGKLVPVRIDATFPPLGFRQQHTIDLSDWQGQPQHAQLQDLVDVLLRRSGDQGEAPAAPVKAAPIQRTGNQRRLLAGLAAGVLLVLAGAGAWWASGSPAEPQIVEEDADDRSKSVAVLPFADLSPEGDQQWFIDGLATEITGTLSRTPDIIAAPVSSTFAFRGTSAPMTQVAQDLAVTHILTGSVRRTDTQMRVSVELLRPADGELVWSQTYDRDPSDAIEVQENIAVEVAKALETVMDPDALAEMASIGTRSLEAYELMLKGGVANYRKAYEVDPEFSFAPFAAASVLFYQMSYRTFGWQDYETALELAPQFREEIQAAIDGSDEDDWIHGSALALQDRFYLRYFDAEKRLAQLHERFPNEPNILSDLIMTQVAIGKNAEAADSIERYVRLGDTIGTWEITAMVRTGEIERAVALADRVADGNDPRTVGRSILAYALADDRKKAFQAMARLRTLDARDNVIHEAQRYLTCAFGSKAEQEAEIAEIAAEDANDPRVAMDRDSPPYVLLYWGYSPRQDFSELPKSRAALDAAGIPYGQPEMRVGACA